jgi:hypothetical protein
VRRRVQWSLRSQVAFVALMMFAIYGGVVGYREYTYQCEKLELFSIVTADLVRCERELNVQVASVEVSLIEHALCASVRVAQLRKYDREALLREVATVRFRLGARNELADRSGQSEFACHMAVGQPKNEPSAGHCETTMSLGD